MVVWAWRVVVVALVVVVVGCDGAGGVGGGVGSRPAPDPSSDGVVRLVTPDGQRFDGGRVSVEFVTDRAYDTCRLQVRGVTLQKAHGLAAGSHTLSTTKLFQDTQHTYQIVCDVDGMPFEGGVFDRDGLGLPLQLDDASFTWYRSPVQSLRVGSLEPCSFSPLGEYAQSRGLDGSLFASMDAYCRWDPSSGLGADDFVEPAERYVIDTLADRGVPASTVASVVSRMGQVEDVLDRDLAWWRIKPRFWWDEARVTERSLHYHALYQSLGLIPAGLAPDARVWGVLEDWFPEEFQQPSKRSDPAITGLSPNPVALLWSMLNYSDSVGSEASWMTRIDPRCTSMEPAGKLVKSFDFMIDRDYIEDRGLFPMVPVSEYLPFETQLVLRRLSLLGGSFGDDWDSGSTYMSTSHSRDLVHGFPAVLYSRRAHLQPLDRNGDGMHTPDEWNRAVGYFSAPYPLGSMDPGEPVGYVNAFFIPLFDANFTAPHIGERLEVRKQSWGGGEDTRPQSGTYSFGVPNQEWGMADFFHPDTPENVGLRMVNLKYALPQGYRDGEPILRYTTWNPCAFTIDGYVDSPY